MISRQCPSSCRSVSKSTGRMNNSGTSSPNKVSCCLEPANRRIKRNPTAIQSANFWLPWTDSPGWTSIATSSTMQLKWTDSSPCFSLTCCSFSGKMAWKINTPYPKILWICWLNTKSLFHSQTYITCWWPRKLLGILFFYRSSTACRSSSKRRWRLSMVGTTIRRGSALKSPSACLRNTSMIWGKNIYDGSFCLFCFSVANCRFHDFIIDLKNDTKIIRFHHFIDRADFAFIGTCNEVWWYWPRQKWSSVF